VDSLKVRKKEPTPYSIDEVDLILDGFSSPEARGFYEIGFWTGLSPSERLGLQWDNVDFEKHCVYIRQAVVANELRDTKNEFRTRQVDLLPPAEKAFKALQQLHPNAEWVFINPKTGDLWRAETIRKRWVAALKTAGLPPGRSYVTRHTYASILLSIGVPLSWIKQQMGHTNYRMLEEVYGRWVEVPPEQRERVLNWFRQMAQNGHIPVAIKAFIKSIQ
ncbi:MAG: site-specific integrase, partial [Candidatus Sedimenticola sp. (ex Thyasira tokunagai)]